MSKSNNMAVPFRLTSITTEQFATFKSSFHPEEEDVNIGFDINIKVNPKLHAVGMFTRFDFIQKSSTVMVLESACHFELDREYWQKQSKENEIVLSTDLLTHFLVLSVGTARGIIHAKKPNWLEGVLLPTFDVSNFITEDRIFKLSDDDHIIEEE